MKVTIVGSYRSEQQQRLLGTREMFASACSAIGGRLAELGHRLIVPDPENDEAAEFAALEGFRAIAPDRFETCFRHTGDPPLKAHFDAVEKSDAVILIGGFNGTYAAGLSALRRRKLIIPVPRFGGSARDLCEIEDIDKSLVDVIRNLDLDKEGWETKLTDATHEILNGFPKILIIHGRGDTGHELRDKILSSAADPDSVMFGVAEPVIMNLGGRGAVSVPDVFEKLASEVHAAIAIVTADDIGGFARGAEGEYPATELKLIPRARENVWVEVGWFWGRLGRERVFLWLKDEIDLPTDLQGVAGTPAATLQDAWESAEAFIKNLRFS